MCGCFHKQAANHRKIVLFNKIVRVIQDSSAFIFILINKNLMTDKYFGRSADPSKVNIDQQAIDVIKNSLLKYKVNSEYYVKVPEKEYLNIVLFLCLYQDTIVTKNITNAFKNINAEEMKEIKEHYFAAKDGVLSIASIFQQKSSKFGYHEPLILKNAPFFSPLPLNTIFENANYSKTLRICEYKERSLTQFDKIPFKAKSLEENKIQDVIVIFPTTKGYNIACFSSKNRQPVNPSFIEEEEIKPNKTKPKQEKKQEEELDKIEQQSEATQEQEKLKANPTETKAVQVEEEKYDEETPLYEQKDYSTFIALLAILGLILLAHNFL